MRLSSLLATLGLALVITLSLPAQTVRVIFVSGQASLQRPDEAALRPAVKGETVIIGTRIVTGADGRVVLTPMPGVKSIITPNTTLLLESASEHRTSATQVTHRAMLNLTEGAVVSDLHKPEGVTYDYSIRTARGIAGARGTTFTVGINAAGIQTVVVAHGTISINFTDGRTATLSPGQLSISPPSGAARSVTGIGDLSEADQQLAQDWIDTTITAIANAVEAGIELDPAALNNALDAAKTLGITLSPETQTSVDRALSTLPETNTTLFNTTEDADPLKELVNDDPQDPSEFVTTPTTTSIDLFRDQLTDAQLIVFNSLPSDVQDKLVFLNDSTVTGVALSPDPETGVHHTHEDLRVHLNAFAELPPAAMAFVKTVGGPDLENSPSVTSWSPAAFERTLTSWNTLTSTEQNLIKSLGAGEAIMDTSAGYISALLGALDSSQLDLIASAGWGESLDDLAGKPTSQSLFQNAGNLSATQLAAVKFFGIDPHHFNDDRVLDTLTLLGALTSTDVDSAEQQILHQLGFAHLALESSFNGGNRLLVVSETETFTFADKIDRTLAFYASLSVDEKTAVRALDLGSFLYHFAPDETLGDSSMTALQRVQQLAAFYNDNPDLQQALRDTQLFSDEHFINDPSPLDSSLITSVLTAYRNLPERTRTYFLTQHHTVPASLLLDPNASGNDGPPFRSLNQINTLLGGLTPTEFSTLLELDLGEAIIMRGYEDYTGDGYTFVDYLGADPLLTLKTTIGHYDQLSTLHKNVLRELGIVGHGNIAVIGADTAGLNRLLAAYGALPEALRAATEKLDDYSSSYATFGSANGAVQDRSFFFPRGRYENAVMYSVRFESTGDLHVGATRYLRIDGSDLSGVDTFVAGEGKDVHLYASDLIELTSTGFAAGIRSITLAAHTLNIMNLTIPEGTVASFNSKLGVLSYSPSTDNGKVNLTNVRYGAGAVLNAINFDSESRGNIAIGTLANPAALPTYTAPAPIVAQ